MIKTQQLKWYFTLKQAHVPARVCVYHETYLSVIALA